MPKKTEIKDVIFARGISHLAPEINALCRKHRITPGDLTRGLLEAACQFYRDHEWFSFPVVIQPEAFQAKYVAEEQAAYEAAKKAQKKPPSGPR